MINVLNNNPVIEYYNKIESGEILVNKKIRRVYKKLVQDIHDGLKGKSEWYYSPNHANHIIDFIHLYVRHTKGTWGNGNRIKLELWQKAFLAASHGFVNEDGVRKYREVTLFVPRKNGKTTLAAGVSLYHFLADGEEGAQCFAVATTRDQAKLAWDDIKIYCESAPALNARVTTRKTDLYHADSNSTSKALASDVHSLEGLNTSFCLGDELHVWKTMELYNVMRKSMSARRNPMMLLTSTMGQVRNGAFDILYNIYENIIKGYDDGNFVADRTLPIIYELDNHNVNIHKPEMWDMCNPNAGVSKDMEQVQDTYNMAMLDRTQLPDLLTKDFNVRAGSSMSWLQFTEYNNETTYDIDVMKFRYYIGGVDLSQSGDWTSACALMRKPNDETFYIQSMFWITQKMYDENPDKLPLETWEKQGYLRVCDGEMIDHKEVVSWFEELQHQKDIYMFKVGYDRWSSSLFVDTMNKSFGETSTIKVAQGAQTLSAPMYHLAALLKSKKINYNNNPILKLHIGNVVVKIDDNANIRPIKGTDDKKKIDGLMALLDAFVVYLDDAEEYDSLC